ncbi:histone-lysine N-methyltransferase family member SUVH9-like [Olea europaea subsp. europaea]|uniref:Histone-lysine N-methyltransferase family member SUVH9-like n=1 Tax=Olea europaea subsp. europaea TaxID=158383 RepID=A0A8S0PEA7_OLEEU|nr:histone-lysine N-methyltransferase family member SUVH9-like [Olea europaea subsp. europaea]
MKQHGLWLNCDKRLVGNIPGVSISDIFFFRMELCVLGLHGQMQAEIDFVTAGQSSNGNGKEHALRHGGKGYSRTTDTWFDVGKSGFGVYKFKLVRIRNQVEMGSEVMKFAKNLRFRPLEVRPKGYVTLDLSRNRENMPVFLFNDIDGDEPVYYEYLTTIVFPL